MIGGQTLQRLARLPIIALLVLGLGLVPGTVAAQTPVTAPTPGEIVVQPKAGVPIDTIAARHGAATLFQFTDSPAALIATPDLNATMLALSKDDKVDWFEANNKARQPAAKEDSGSDPYCGAAVVNTSTVAAKEDSGSDPYCTRIVAGGIDDYNDQWLDYTVNLRWAHKRSQGQGVVIAVLDTAVEAHPALAGKTLPGIDLVPLDPSTNVATQGTKRGHGTFVAGVALHVAPQARILPIRVLNEDGRGSTSLVAEGIRRAAKAGAKVINLSLSTPTPARAMRDAVDYAKKQGAVIVAAYGNEGMKTPPVFPANFSDVISVVATDETGVKAAFTNYGDKADVAAPGVNIVGPWRDGQYGLGSGTSYATPVVSGEAAILLAAGVAKNGGEVANKIIGGVDNIDKLNGAGMGFGRVNFPAALLK
jgi:thermitase